MNLPIPDIIVDDIYQISPKDISSRGIKFLMMDLDNTLAPYHIDRATDKLVSWVEGLKAEGIELFILSNNHGLRPSVFSEQLGIDFINKAKKPTVGNALQVMHKKGYEPSETGLIGDQIYTDVLCAVRCNITAICVKPICVSRNPLMAIRYFFEFPFRIVGQNRKVGINK